MLDSNSKLNTFNTLLLYSSIVFVLFSTEVVYFYFFRDFLLLFVVSPVIYLFNESDVRKVLTNSKAQFFMGSSLLMLFIFHYYDNYVLDILMLILVGFFGLYLLLHTIYWNDIVIKSWYFFVKVVNFAFFIFLISLYIAEYFGIRFAFDPLFIIISLLLYFCVFSIYTLNYTFKRYAGTLHSFSSPIVSNDELTPKELELKKRMDTYLNESDDFLKMNFDLKMLQEQTGIHKTELSRIIKKGYAGNFYQLLAEKRIALAIQRLDNLQGNKTIESVMIECGFSSKSVFNRHFKNITGFTPSEYLGSLHLKQTK